MGRVLGISCDYHDAAACLVVDGRLVAAAEEERFSRAKHDSGLPRRSMASCLRIGDVRPDELDAVVFHEKPLLVAGRVLAARQSEGLSGLGAFVSDYPRLLRRNLFVGYRIEKELRRLGARRRPVIRYAEHHLSHAAAAFLPSPFPSAATLTVDGIGEWSTATIGRGTGDRVELLTEQRYPDSLGLLYSMVTAWCGFEPNDGEYKLMGLAPYGSPKYLERLREVVEVRADGSIAVDLDAVGHWRRRPERLDRLVELFDGPPRRADELLRRRDLDLASSAQELLEEVVLAMAATAHDLTGESAVCLAGGVALNCVANSRLLRDGPFDEVWIQPAAGDAGSALGAALWYSTEVLGDPRAVAPGQDAAEGAGAADGMRGSLVGPEATPEEVGAWIDSHGLRAKHFDDEQELCDAVAARLDAGEVVGWVQGRMEFGPRALGNRSILADPRPATVGRDLNQRVKGRESFRPFAPAVLWECAADWFDIDRPSPYMLFTHQVATHRTVEVATEPDGLLQRARVPRSTIPACTHVDGSARVQTVHRETNPRFHRLLSAFLARTGCPVLLNTSFNRAGEPIVCTPDDALRSARASGLDLLVVGDHLVEVDPMGDW